ncbi:MAG TPA: hypothetical protein VD886_01105, partial [Herpetosiphonaceae bacterium]|nr:hypothetical protein [Herpetosiphonaceae bacterium]
MPGYVRRAWSAASRTYLILLVAALPGWFAFKHVSPASPIAFEQVRLPATRQPGADYTSLAIGPDGKLYASTVSGLIVRFALNADGVAGAPDVLPALQQANADPRLAIGLAFDPRSTADELVAWVSHTRDTSERVPDWTGTITRLSGPRLEHVQDFV